MGARYENDLRSMQDMFNGTCDGVLPEQPRTIKLASWLEADARSIEIKKEAAIELRRLHALNLELLEALHALCDAADDSNDFQYGTLSTSFVLDIARAAIAKATGEVV